MSLSVLTAIIQVIILKKKLLKFLSTHNPAPALSHSIAVHPNLIPHFTASSLFCKLAPTGDLYFITTVSDKLNHIILVILGVLIDVLARVMDLTMTTNIWL